MTRRLHVCADQLPRHGSISSATAPDASWPLPLQTLLGYAGLPGCSPSAGVRPLPHQIALPPGPGPDAPALLWPCPGAPACSGATGALGLFELALWPLARTSWEGCPSCMHALPTGFSAYRTSSSSSQLAPAALTTVQEPNYKPAVELLPAAQVLAEQAQGRYSAAALLEGKPAGTSKAPAVADWVGPLEVFESPTAGRGLRATAAVAAGELLLVERALASAQVGSSQQRWLGWLHGLCL